MRYMRRWKTDSKSLKKLEMGASAVLSLLERVLPVPMLLGEGPW